MMTIRVLSKGVRVLSIPLFLALLVIVTGCSQSSDAVLIDNDDIGGTVEGQNGPEAFGLSPRQPIFQQNFLERS